MKGSGYTSRAPTPIETANGEAVQPKSIRKIDHILADGRLLRHSRTRSTPKTCGTVASQVRHQHTIPGFRERRCHIVEGVNIVRKTVKQNDRHPGRRPRLLVADRKHWCRSSSGHL